MTTKQPPSISAANLQATMAPPTTIREAPGVPPAVVIDPIALVKVWATTADVLRDVCRVAEENQADNKFTRDTQKKMLRIHVLTAAAVIVASVASVVAHLWF